MPLFLLLFLFVSSPAHGLLDDEENTEVVDKIIKKFEAMAAPSDNYLDSLDLFQKTVPSFLNLSESFGDLFFFSAYSENTEIPYYLIRDMMNVPSTTKLFQYFSGQYDMDRHAMRSPFYLTVKMDDLEYSLIRNVSRVLNHYFEYGFMGFLDPEVSPETMVQNINVFYASCEQETIGIESVAKEMNKWLVKSCSRNNRRLLEQIESFFLHLIIPKNDWRIYYHYFEDDEIILKFKAHMLSIDDIDKATEIVENMEKRYKYNEKDVELLFEEAFNVTANRTPCLLDMIPSYDRRELAAFIKDLRFEMSRMLVSGLLCAAPDPKSEKTSLEAVGSLVLETAHFLRGYFVEKLKKSIYEEEKIVKQILVKSLKSRKVKNSFWSSEDYIPDVEELLEQWNESLSNIGEESVRRQYLLITKDWLLTQRSYRNYFTCKRESCFFLTNMYGTDSLISRYIETNETAVEEFTKQAKVLYRQILPIVTSSNEERDTVEKIVEEIKRRGISLTDTYIGSTAIIRHIQSDGKPCKYQSTVLVQGGGNLPAAVVYRTKHRVIQWFLFDVHVCTEIYFFM